MLRRRDGGSTHTLEIFVVLTVMMVAVTSVSTFTNAPSSLDPLERLITTKTQDVINTWADHPMTPSTDCDPTTKLERLIFDALEDEHTLWDDSIERRFGPGYDVDMVLDNYHGLYPLHGTGRVVGSTAHANWAPEQTYVKALPRVDAVSGTEPIGLDSAAVHWASLARTKGDAVRTSVTFDDLSGTAESTRQVWSATSLLDGSVEGEKRTAGANLGWRIGEWPSGQVALSRELGVVETQTGIQTKVLLQVRVDGAPVPQTDEAPVPIGTTLVVHLPPGWREIGWIDSDLGSWVNESASEIGENGYDLRAVVRGTPSQSRTLTVTAYAPTDGLRPFDVITARLQGGSLSESSLVVTYPVESTDHSAPRVLYPTTPYALRAGSWGLFGVAIANGGDDMVVTQVDIEIPGGYDLAHNDGEGAPLFTDSFERMKPATGWNFIDARHIQWKASRGVATDSSDDADPVTIPAFKAADFYVNVRITPETKYATAIESATSNGPNATLRFDNGYEVTSGSWGKSPGIVSFRVLPASEPDTLEATGSTDGYPWSEDALLTGAERTFTLESNSSLAHLSQEGSYTLRPGASDLVNVESAITNASFEVANRKIPIGTLLRADGDFESLMSTLDALSLPSTLTLELHTPPSLGCRPITWAIDTATLPKPDVVKTLLWDDASSIASYFAATDDGYLFRIDAATGAPIWSATLTGIATTIEPMDLGLNGQYLLVGTSGGVAQSVRTSDGEVVWTSTILAGEEDEGDMPLNSAVATRFDAARMRVYAAAGTDLVMLDVTNGGELDSALFDEPLVDVIANENGIYVLSETTLRRLDADLNTLQSEGSLVGALGLAGGTRIVVADATYVSVYDALTLDVVSTDSTSTNVLTATGDGSGDGVPDLAVASGSSEISLYSGASGALLWQVPASMITQVNPGAFDFPSGSIVNTPSNEMCVEEDWPAEYASDYACTNIGTEVFDLVVDNGRTGVSFRNGADTAIRQLGPTGSVIVIGDDFGAQGTALALGSWGLDEHAVLYGNDIGNAILYASGVDTTSTPSDRIGKFSFYMIVPEGGFFGTHLLVARLAWEQAGIAQEAQLVDWFEVVAKNGDPVLNPAYRASLTVSSRDDPIRTG